MNQTGIEIERKFLLKDIPDLTQPLLANAKQVGITQTYLLSKEAAKEWKRRVRVIDGEDGVHYYYTQKRHVSELSREEFEREISLDVYHQFLKERDGSRVTLKKRRYYIPYDSKTFELDIFEYPHKVAILEIELESETQEFNLPDFLDIDREVTLDKTYSNRRMAKLSRINMPLEAAKPNSLNLNSSEVREF